MAARPRPDGQRTTHPAGRAVAAAGRPGRAHPGAHAVPPRGSPGLDGLAAAHHLHRGRASRVYAAVITVARTGQRWNLAPSSPGSAGGWTGSPNRLCLVTAARHPLAAGLPAPPGRHRTAGFADHACSPTTPGPARACRAGSCGTAPGPGRQDAARRYREAAMVRARPEARADAIPQAWRPWMETGAERQAPGM